MIVIKMVIIMEGMMEGKSSDSIIVIECWEKVAARVIPLCLHSTTGTILYYPLQYYTSLYFTICKAFLSSSSSFLSSSSSSSSSSFSSSSSYYPHHNLHPPPHHHHHHTTDSIIIIIILFPLKDPQSATHIHIWLHLSTSTN